MKGELRAQCAALVGFFSFACTIVTGGAALADQTSLDVGDAPIINLVARGKVSVQTWPRPQVQAASNAPLTVRLIQARRLRSGVQREIRVLSGSAAGPRGAVSLPEETFVLSPGDDAAHAAVMIKADGSDTTIKIPASTALFVSRMRHGVLRIENYARGTFVVRVHTGAVLLQNMGGDGFVQVLRGRIVARDSSFNRLRERTARGNIIFERCNAKQIQVTSVDGSIRYDHGKFEPGLAQFESVNGNVTLGIATGGAQISARSGVGRVFHAVNATIGGGGPLVTAASTNGAIFLFDRRSRGQHPPQWHTRRPGTRMPRIKAKISLGRPHQA